jgi:hypothetical protein
VQPASVEPQRLLGVELVPSIVAQVSQHLEPVIVVLREAALGQLPSGTVPRATDSAWRSRVRRPAWTRKTCVVIWIARSTTPNQVGVHAPSRSREGLLNDGHGTFLHPMMQTTTPVPVAGALRVVRSP